MNIDSGEIHRCTQSGGGKLEEEGTTAPPALPPRPPPRPRHTNDNPSRPTCVSRTTRVRKYVFLCTVCGGLACLLGAFFLTVYLTLRTYTSSLDYFETIPTYIPASMLMITGLAVMCLARRKNRYVFLIKLCGISCLLCAGTCVLVTVTTTVLHMSRLQSLRECVYTLKTQTCTCYSVLLESASDRTDEGTRYVFSATPDCEVIHGALYSCLRALFGISVTGILVCIFCCMLVYQLLSHERKKMYWEQLELRCRYLYGQAPAQVQTTQNVLPSTQTTQHCICCQQFRYRQDVLAWEPTDNRFWTSGHVGNLYSPNPVGEECTMATSTPSRTSLGWSWRRLPWSRQSGDSVPLAIVPQQRDAGGYHRPLNCSSPDSQYGFSMNHGQNAADIATVSTRTASYTMIDPVTQACQVYQWGPPPPYSDPNSPSRRGICPPGFHHHHCQGKVRSEKESRHGDNYVNTSIDEGEAVADEGSSSVFSNDDSCLALTLRRSSRKIDLPPSSSSSSMKSNPYPNSGNGECSHQENKAPPKTDDNTAGNCRGCCVSPTLKYLQGKTQNLAENIIRKQAQELTESEVYFADVSSCCNFSVKNDSMSIYDEALGNKSTNNGERVLPLPGVPYHHHHNHNIDLIKKQPRFVHNSDTKSQPLQTNSFIEGTQKLSECHQIPEEMTESSKATSLEDCFCSDAIIDGSEEDDPELVNFSKQRQTSLRNRMTFHCGKDNKPSCDTNRNNRLEPGDPDDYPSPVSISSPSTGNKCYNGFYSENVNSDNGSSDSVWVGYSPDFLAPDAQYETIPEHRLIPAEDFNGNPKGKVEHRGIAKVTSVSKRKNHIQSVGESWLGRSTTSQDLPEERQRYLDQTINSSKQGISLKRNDKGFGNTIHSPKTISGIGKNCNVQDSPDAIVRRQVLFHSEVMDKRREGLERRRGELLNTGQVCEMAESIQCCGQTEDSKNIKTCDVNIVSQNRCKPTNRDCTINSSLTNCPELNENRCCHSENSCKCFVVENIDQSEIRSVNV